MSRLFCFLLALFLNIGAGNERFAGQAPPPGSSESRGLWLARQIDDRDTGRDARTAVRMRLYDRQNRVRERALVMLSLAGGPGRPVAANRTLLRFTRPADIAGTGLLVWERPSGDAERFLYLPALGRVRRIAVSEAQESFVGSDFSYEDIGGRDLDTFSYALVNDAAEWKAPDGGTHPAYRLESRHKDAGARFPRVVSTVRRDNFVVVHAEIYNRRAERQKVFEAGRVERRDGYWTVLEMTMRDLGQRSRTELVVERVEYDVGLTPDDFSRRALERGAGPTAQARP
jgi:hypothetical protein